MSACFCWLSSLQFLILVRGLRFWVLPFPCGSRHTILFAKAVTLCLDEPQDCHTSSSQRSWKEDSCVVFSLKRFSPRVSPFPQFRGCEERWGVGGLLMLEGAPPAPAILLPHAFSGLSQVFEGGIGVRALLSEEVLMRLRPPLPFAHPQKDPKLL